MRKIKYLIIIMVLVFSSCNEKVKSGDIDSVTVMTLPDVMRLLSDELRIQLSYKVNLTEEAFHPITVKVFHEYEFSGEPGLILFKAYEHLYINNIHFDNYELSNASDETLLSISANEFNLIFNFYSKALNCIYSMKIDNKDGVSDLLNMDLYNDKDVVYLLESYKEINIETENRFIGFEIFEKENLRFCYLQFLLQDNYFEFSFNMIDSSFKIQGISAQEIDDKEGLSNMKNYIISDIPPPSDL